MTATLCLASACQPSEAPESGIGVPRGLETRVVESTVYGECQELGSSKGELRPVECGGHPAPTESRELLLLSEPGRDATPGERAVAAAAAVALSADPRTLERSIATVAPAAGAEPADVTGLIALGALQHARARATGDPAFLVDALENTYVALREHPASRAALFNRAVIEGDFGLCRQARKSWRAYLAADRSSEWAEEGRIRYRALPCGEASRRPAGPGVRPLDPSERARFFEETLEDLLPVWLDARRESPEASDQALEQIAERAARLAADSDDPWLTELVDELRRSVGQREHIQAVRSYVRGRALFRTEDYLAARRALSAARPSLSDRDSVLLPWCDLWLAGTDLYHGRFQAAGERLDRLVEDSRIERSPMLAGRVFWALGLASFRAGRMQDAYDRYSEAEQAFERGGYLASIASVRMLKAEALADLGFVAESWRDRVATLRALQGPDPHFMLRNGLLDGATVAGRHGAPRAAGSLLDEVQAIAEESEDSVTATEAVLFRAEVLLDAGEPAEAAEAFDRALEAAGSISQELVKERFEAHARLGLWAAESAEGNRDLSDLDRIIRFYAAKGPRSLQLLALRVKARRAMESGSEALARETVMEAIREIRRTQRQLREETFELRHWEMAQAIFDEAVLLAVGSAAPVEALDFLEEARDLIEGPTRAFPFGSCELAEPGRSYPTPGLAGSIVLAFGVAGEELLWWRIDGDRCLFGRGDARGSRAPAERLLSAAGPGRLAPEDLDRLYEDLLADPLRGVPPNTGLRLVPDRYLLRVPFAALRNPVTAKRLVEERAISFHQDLASALGSAVDARGASSREDWSVLAVGDPAFDRSSLPWLERLPGARVEAERVASRYSGRSELLLGESAVLARIRGESRGRQVLHLAVHAVTSPGGVSDGLVLGSDRLAGGSSGLTPMRDLLTAIPPDLELVVLSGCTTLGTTPTRSSGLVGLARPFIARGVPAVVATLWPVRDDLLGDLMARFHAGILEGSAASDALRRAQIEVLERSPQIPCCDWAAVQLYGELPAVAPGGVIH